MKLEQFEVMEERMSDEVLFKVLVKFSLYEIECMKAELGPEEFQRLLSEHITKEILKEIERRCI